MTSTAPIWTIPPIQDAIASHLDQKDFLNCVQVSQLLHRVFIPCLWSEVNILKDSDLNRMVASPAHSRNRRHIKSILLYYLFAANWTAYVRKHGPLLGLVSFEITYGLVPDARATMDLLDTFASHPQLETLQLELLNVPAVFFKNTFLGTMSQLTHLKRVEAVFQMALEEPYLVPFLSAFRHVEELILSCTVSPKISLDYLLAVDFPTTKIKYLWLLCSGHLGYALQGRFLAACPNLGRLKLSKTWMMPNNQICPRLDSVVTSNCTLLKDLDIQLVPAEDAVRMLRHCPVLKRLKIMVESHDGGIIESAIMEYQGQGLEHLDMVQWGNHVTTLEQLFALVERCTRLKSVIISIQRPYNLVQDVTVVEELVRKSWPSSGIQWKDICIRKSGQS